MILINNCILIVHNLLDLKENNCNIYWLSSLNVAIINMWVCYYNVERFFKILNMITCTRQHNNTHWCTYSFDCHYIQVVYKQLFHQWCSESCSHKLLSICLTDRSAAYPPQWWCYHLSCTVGEHYLWSRLTINYCNNYMVNYVSTELLVCPLVL